MDVSLLYFTSSKIKHRLLKTGLNDVREWNTTLATTNERGSFIGNREYRTAAVRRMCAQVIDKVRQADYMDAKCVSNKMEQTTVTNHNHDNVCHGKHNHRN